MTTSMLREFFSIYVKRVAVLLPLLLLVVFVPPGTLDAKLFSVGALFVVVAIAQIAEFAYGSWRMSRARGDEAGDAEAGEMETNGEHPPRGVRRRRDLRQRDETDR